MKRRSFLKTVLGVGVGLVGASARHSVPLRNIGISDDSLLCGNEECMTFEDSNELAFGNEFQWDVDFDH